jgi:hypothetical protein
MFIRLLPNHSCRRWAELALTVSLITLFIYATEPGQLAPIFNTSLVDKIKKKLFLLKTKVMYS